MSFLRKYLPFLTLALAISGLYLFDLSAVGVLGPDEPRYAAIGEAMGHTGRLITPLLWGSPWFEKPPLLYWMTALATWAGLKGELAGRAPVALLSLVFLAVSFRLVKNEFGVFAAAISVGMLATSAGWLAYSGLCLTDLPLAVCFSLAVFLALPLLRNSRTTGPVSSAPPEEPASSFADWRRAAVPGALRREPPLLTKIGARLTAIGALIGLGALAKGLVPLALAAPFFWFLRAYWRKWWVAVAACLAVALPWYIAVYVENGYPFLQEFFVKHHLERLYSASLQHVQPWYYYFPVVVLGLFPWTPMLGVLFNSGFQWDRRKQFLAAIFLFGFVIFSISLNKLPGYVLPILPALLILISSFFEDKSAVEIGKGWLVACAVLIALIPFLASVLPGSLVIGRYTWSAIKLDRTALFYIIAPLAVILLARRSWMPALLALSIVAGGIYVKSVCYPVIDDRVSARGVWRRIQFIENDVCDGGTNRDWIYGLNFYLPRPMPYCGTGPFHYMMRSNGRTQPTITPVHP